MGKVDFREFFPVFNINLLKIDSQKETNKFFTNLTSYFLHHMFFSPLDQFPKL